MAISPEEANKLTKEEEKLLEDLEKEIDETLRSGKRVFDNLPENVSVKIINQLKDNYHFVGWCVEYDEETEKLKFTPLESD
jgi:hypothetical protein